MKILFLHNLADPERGGGGEVTVWTLMRSMRDAGHECVMLATSDRPGLERTKREDITIWRAHIRNVHWPHRKKRPTVAQRLLWHALDSYNPWMQPYLQEVIARERPDVASVHALPGWSVASWRTLAREGLPAVQVLHGYEAICPRATMYRGGRNCEQQCTQCRAFRLPHRALSRHLQAVVGVSRFVLDRHRSLGYFGGVPIQRVIHNARDPQALGSDVGTHVEPHEGLRFGFIGRLHPSKGVEALVDAFLSADLPEACLWIAGSGDEGYERYLRARVTDKRIRFLGRIPPRDFFPHVDATIVPSLWNEPLGMVVAEALAFGKPVIGSRRGGIPEMIRDGENGLVFEPDAPGELSAALHAMRDDRRRAQLTESARPSAAPFLDIAKWTRKYEALYREVAAAPPAAVRLEASQEGPDAADG